MSLTSWVLNESGAVYNGSQRTLPLYNSDSKELRAPANIARIQMYVRMVDPQPLLLTCHFYTSLRGSTFVHKLHPLRRCLT